MAKRGVISMQSTGIVRKLDSLGRITLPMELRKSFEIGEREPLEIFTEEDRIIIKKYNPSDIFTGQCEDLIEYRGKKVSRDSIRELARIAGFTLSEQDNGLTFEKIEFKSGHFSDNI